jgi:hypothetical protein
MAVNENLYNWMFKTYGMQPAEWYRNNPGKPPESNPFLPKGSYVPKAQNQPTGPRGEQLFASVSPDFVEASVIEPAPGPPSEDEIAKFERYYNQSKQQLGISDPLSTGEYAAAGGLYYYPDYGEYGGYLTKTNPDAAQVARVREMMAQQAAGTADPSWSGQDLSGLISTKGAGGWHVRAATEQDAEVQKYGIYNVGRSDYLQNRRNQAIQKNIDILLQQAESGNQNSQAFLDQYVTQSPGDTAPETGPRGEEISPQKGPRGEDMGEIAWNTPAIPKGPYTPVRNFGSKDKPFYGPSTKDTHNNPSGERILQMRYEAQAPAEFDEQKAQIARQAADEYRRRGQVEDPFRAAAVG